MMGIIAFIAYFIISTTLALPPQQRFAIEPVDKTAIVNDTILLACRVVNKVGTLQWTRDSFGLGTDRDLVGYPRYTMSGNDEEGDFSLQIRNVNLEDDAKFQCQVGAAEGVRGIRSRDATLTVYVPPEPPTIVEGDFLRTTAGTQVVLTCEAMGGKPAAELTWLDPDGNPVPSEEVSYSTQLLSDGKRANAFLKWTFQPTREHDGKAFSCRAENPALKKPLKTAIKLEVKYAPDVKLTVDKEYVFEGDDVRFTCEASANPSNVIYKWYKKDGVVVGDPSTSYILRKVSREDNDVAVTCEVSNAVGVAKASHVLSINFGPVLRHPLPQVFGVSMGQEVKLRCDVAGNPTPEIAWFFDVSPRVISTDAELVIPSVTYDSAGRYICRASVKGFPEISTSTQVFIKGPPRVTSSPVQYAPEGEMARVECLVQSVPPPTRVTWTRDRRALDPKDPSYEMVEEKLEGASLIRNVLLIHKPSQKDFGLYNCSVENEFGEDFIVIQLNPQRTFPIILVMGIIIGSVVCVVCVTIFVILCMRKKSVLDGSDFMSDIVKKGSASTGTASIHSHSNGKGTHHHHHNQQNHFGHMVGDNGSSGADSDVKVEIRTSSSLSEQREWIVDPTSDLALQHHHQQEQRSVTANEIAQVVENIYNYTQQQEAAFSVASTGAAVTSAKVDPSQNNNASNNYVTFVDYGHDHYLHYQPHHHHLYTAQPASLVMTAPVRDSYVDPYGTLTSTAAATTATVDPRYGRAFMTNTAYVRPSHSYAGSGSSGGGGVGVSPSHSPSHHFNHLNGHLAVHQQTSHQQPQISSLYSAAGHTIPSNQLYITTPGVSQPVKQGSLATHV